MSNILNNIINDFKNGFAMGELISHNPAITVFGGARLTSDSSDYKAAELLGKKLAENNISVITGGGPGIMEAANKGAFKHYKDNNLSVAMGIQLPCEQKLNGFHSFEYIFKYFFARKVLLTKYSFSFVYFKGGFGTMDELFEVLTLIQTKKIQNKTIYLYNSQFFNPLIHYMKNVLLPSNTISKEDLNFSLIY